MEKKTFETVRFLIYTDKEMLVLRKFRRKKNVLYNLLNILTIRTIDVNNLILTLNEIRKCNLIRKMCRYLHANTNSLIYYMNT